MFISSVFNDFGPAFTCVDPTGEQPLTGMIAAVDEVRSLIVEIVDHSWRFNRLGW
jgi:ubiquitin-activating enzyme E1